MTSPAKDYRPKQAVTAAKVARPYKAVADWCGGRIVTRYGPGSTVLGIQLDGAYGENVFAALGDYIGTDPANPGYFTKYDGEEFERYFERVPNGPQNT